MLNEDNETGGPRCQGKAFTPRQKNQTNLNDCRHSSASHLHCLQSVCQRVCVKAKGERHGTWLFCGDITSIKTHTLTK